MSLSLTASDARQWSYCPRVLYFTYVAPVLKKPTYKMEMGQRQERSVQALEKRRVLRRYGLERAERLFNVRLHSAARGLTGVIDMVLRDGAQAYPVEFKHSRRDHFHNHKLQLTAYAVLLEETQGATVPCGFIHNSWSGRTYRVEITANLRAELEMALHDIRRMVASERLPAPTPQRSKCTDCEFRNWCADVL